MFTIEDIIRLHIIMLIFSWYNYYVSKLNFPIYNTLHKLFTKKEQLIEFVQIALKIIFIEELCYRVYLNEILDYILYDWAPIISSICFAVSHFVNYHLVKKYNLQNIRMTIAQVIYSFVLSYFYLQNTTPLGSLILHQYTNMICIILQYYFHNY